MIIYLFHAAVAMGTVATLMHDIHLIRFALGLLFGPPCAAQLLAGGHGSWKPILIYALYVLYLSTIGKKLNLAYLQQISDNYDLSVLAHHDDLTGLPNRLLMRDLVSKSLADAREHGVRIAVFFLDFDGFKQINDQYSHEIGDSFLCEVAKRLTVCVQSSGIVARLGGDEFTVLITGSVSAELAAGIARRILEACREPFRIGDRALTCTVSIGVSLYPDDAAGVDQLLRAADKAMYTAKTLGKNRICFAPGNVPFGRDLESFAGALSDSAMRPATSRIGDP